MVAVTIVKAFTLTHDQTTDITRKGQDEYIPVGVHDFPEEMANHWYVAAHSDHPPVSNPRPGTPEYGAQQAAAMRRRKLIEMAIEQEAIEAGQKVKQDSVLSGRIAEVEEQVQAEEQAQHEEGQDQAARDEAVRSGRRVALPQRHRAPLVEPPAV